MRNVKISLALIVLAVVLGPATRLGADVTRHLSRSLNFCGEAVPLNQPEIYQAVDQNLILLAEAKSRVWLTLRRSSRYLPVVTQELNRAGVPDDLKYIPLAITSMAPEYNSGGRGLWRLREAEARALGLRIDQDVDERLDPVASTAAAANRLKQLKATFGTWTMAMAAHLLGESYLSQAVLEAGGTQDFYALYLPDGLDQLPATVLAGKVIFQDPGSFGYNQSQDRGWPSLSTRRVAVSAPTTARALAAQYNNDYKLFRDMNPHLLTGQVPAGVTVNVP